MRLTANTPKIVAAVAVALVVPLPYCMLAYGNIDFALYPFRIPFGIFGGYVGPPLFVAGVEAIVYFVARGLNRAFARAFGFSAIVASTFACGYLIYRICTNTPDNP
jgi:hypothetical protein